MWIIITSCFVLFSSYLLYVLVEIIIVSSKFNKLLQPEKTGANRQAAHRNSYPFAV